MSGDNGLLQLIDLAGEVIGSLLPIAVSAALLFFIWGLAKFIRASGDPKSKEEGKNRMIWGIVALFIIVSIWGIVRWVGGVIGIDENREITIPQIPTND